MSRRCVAEWRAGEGLAECSDLTCCTYAPATTLLLLLCVRLCVARARRCCRMRHMILEIVDKHTHGAHTHTHVWHTHTYTWHTHLLVHTRNLKL